MSDADLLSLYSTQILSLASNIGHQGRLITPDGVGKARSMTCGSQISVELELDAGKISCFAQEVQACALGQAGAGVLGEVVLGSTKADITKARSELHAMLTQNGPVPSAPFSGFEALLPVKDFANRHASVLLALDATLAAIDDATEKPTHKKTTAKAVVKYERAGVSFKAAQVRFSK
ncbi:MAG: NifU-like protein involved in Fe-S cluster formation [Paracoccaceae bacterium]|jgi:NifU-like protein involved in Fe-S cluster formation